MPKVTQLGSGGGRIRTQPLGAQESPGLSPKKPQGCPRNLNCPAGAAPTFFWSWSPGAPFCACTGSEKSVSQSLCGDFSLAFRPSVDQALWPLSCGSVCHHEPTGEGRPWPSLWCRSCPSPPPSALWRLLVHHVVQPWLLRNAGRPHLAEAVRPPPPPGHLLTRGLLVL